MALILVGSREVEGLSPLHILPEEDAVGCVLSLDMRLKVTSPRSANAGGMVDLAIKACSDPSVVEGAVDVAVPPTISPRRICSAVPGDPVIQLRQNEAPFAVPGVLVRIHVVRCYL